MQTSTYIASPYRGSGLFEQARCRQLHDMATVLAWAELRDTPVEAFVTSIAAWNERSLRASRLYTAENNWPDTWEQAREAVSGRDAHVFRYPPPVPAHRCFLHDS